MANDRNYEKLKAAWKGWRDASGKKIKNLYPQYVDLLNEAITFEGCRILDIRSDMNTMQAHMSA
ncbi:hypothetical protein CHS0354_019653 [Potamilus streckersoni]|uniref:Uncharacterized protein n=1 Tax=Potamilus streckersoni TaxID=2493646 RepID=A0AAE0T8Z2_9BIVA|nr:hypothetical protein CHS0354_019653 [Potamilus streckersoni]